MKKIIISLSLAVITLGFILIIQSCGKDDPEIPTASTMADFVYTADNDLIAPTTVTFINKSIKAVSYHWDFGNGSTSTEKNPVFTYTEAGLYKVVLTVEPENNVYYNKLVKETNILVKSPGSLEPKTLFFTSRATGKVHYIVLDTIDPVVLDFPTGGLYKPYGIAVDNANLKVYVTDTDGLIYRYDFNGNNGEVILDAAQVPEVGEPYGILVIGDKIYWAKEAAIYMANLDGSDPQPFAEFSGAPEFPLGMAYDSIAKKIYLVNDKYDFSGGVYTINLDGSGLMEIIPGVDAGAITLDLTHGKLYYTDWIGGVFMANLDGSGVTNINPVMDQNFSWGITVDPEDGFVYVADKGHDIIIRSALDGAGSLNWVTDVDPYAMTIYFPE
ncbi:MAG: PKD domain-containing protein [Bacteroidetes bacterium]|nr:PKD domain-containing protein [Bacteroidota bacterium]